MTVKSAGKWIEGLTAEMAATKAARRALKVRLNDVIRWVSATSAESAYEADFIHQLRVATRRASATLAVFRPYFKPRLRKKLNKRLRRIRQAAGEVRDWDIFQSMLNPRHRGGSALSPEADMLARASARLRTKALQKLLDQVEQDSAPKLRRARTRLLSRMRQSTSLIDDGVMVNAHNASQADIFPGSLLYHANLTVTALVSDLCAAGKEDLQDLASLHQFRICAKRLRYAVEILRPCFEKTAYRELYDELEAMQDRLGAINDLHQAVTRLGEVADRGLKKLKRRDPPEEAVQSYIDALRRQYQEKCEYLTREFLNWWKSQGETLLQSFAQAVALPAGSNGKPRTSKQLGAAETPAAAGGLLERFRAHGSLNEMPRNSSTGPRRVGAIDVGTNSIRLIVAEVTSDGTYRVLDDEREMTRLGRNLQASGRLAPEAMEQSVMALARMRSIAEGYGVEILPAIGTQAIREATNSDEFLALAKERAGLVLEPITAEEEAHLAYLSVSHAFDLRATPVAIADMGGGSTEIVMSLSGVVEEVYSMPLGAVRLTEQFGGAEACATKRYREMRQAVNRRLKKSLGRLPFVPQFVIGTGGTFTTLANVLRHRDLPPDGLRLTTSSLRGYEMKRSEVRHLLEMLRKIPLAARTRVAGLSAERADIIVAGAVIAERLMKQLQVNRLRVHDGGVRDGLLLAVINAHMPGSSRTLPETPDPIRSVRQFAATCGYEDRHCNHVARLAAQILEQLVSSAGIAANGCSDPSSRTVLEGAAILHDVGYLINYSKHHEHSYHLILHSNLSGFTPREIALMANVARYHRRAEPKRNHANFAALNKGDRKLVRLLAAVLRVADGLDRSNMQNVRGLSVQVETEAIRLSLDASENPEVEIWGAQRKSRLLEKALGRKVVFEWQPPDATEPGLRPEPLSTSTVSQQEPS